MAGLIQIVYFAAAALFILGLKRMSSPKTARSGIVWAGAGMALATLVTFLYPGLSNYLLILVAIGVGSYAAWVSGKKVAMTDMPQMIAIYNGMGGGAAACIAAVELLKGGSHGAVHALLGVLGALIGAVSFSGSVVAWAKLDGRMKKAIRFPRQKLVNLGVFVLALLFGLIVMGASQPGAFSIIAFFPAGARLRRDDGAADRRCRHAGGHLAVQRLHRSCGRV